jgi:hypothetical protein
MGAGTEGRSYGKPFSPAFLADSGGLEPPTPGSVGRKRGICEPRESAAKLRLPQKTLVLRAQLAACENQREPAS